MKKSATQSSSKRQSWKKNPLFLAGDGHYTPPWTEERRKAQAKRMAKYNKSRAGKKMASKRSKKLFKDEPEQRQRLAEMRQNEPKNCIRRMKARERGYNELQQWNQERHQKVEKRRAIERARASYSNGNVKPIIKPLPNQSDEYYDLLDDFFAEGF